MFYSDLETHQFTHDVFELLKNTKTKADFNNIYTEKPILEKYKMDKNKYPPLQFSISSEEVQQMKKDNYIDNDLYFDSNIGSKIKDPLAKILYAILWKKGDLKKEKHILRGILNIGNSDEPISEGLVFYQFGKHLNQRPHLPIIDQHVIRAFIIYKSKIGEDISGFRKIGTLDKKYQKYIDAYNVWLKNDIENKNINNLNEYMYEVDQLLFAVGKSIKITKKITNQ